MSDSVNNIHNKRVRYLPISDVCIVVSPKVKVKARDYLKSGKYPVIDQGSSLIGGYSNEDKAFPEGEYIIFGDHTCIVKYIDFSFLQGADGVKVLQARDFIIPKYLFYCMDNIKMDADYSRHWGKMKSMVIPVPDVDVQKDIVKKLDCFTGIISKLEEELSLRKIQFQFLIDKIYGVDSSDQMRMKESGIDVLSMQEIGTFTRGKRFVKADSVEEGIPAIHYGELYTYYGTSANMTKSYIDRELANKLRFAEKGDVIIVAAGENNVDIGVGVAWEGDKSVAVHDACYTYSHKQNPRYISYYLRSNIYHHQIKKYVAEGKICSISAEGIGRATLPIPSIQEQNRIVKQLNVFNQLCYSGEQGIPAEIMERRKQYIYYRNQLLQL